jgi:organic hydroperoxide reductase OsmC/OhrA
MTESRSLLLRDAMGENMTIHIEARVDSARNAHHAAVTTNGLAREIAIPPRSTGLGSSVNGGELLCLALATCYCNDVYREAALRRIEVSRVVVHVDADFGAPGEPAAAVRYRADVSANSSEADIRALMLHTDQVAEIQNTLRCGIAVDFAIGDIVASA